MEVPGSTPIAALFLELSVLPIKFEIKQRQLFFLTRILDKDHDDPIHVAYKYQLNYNFEENWQVIFLSCDMLIIFPSMIKISRE